MSAYPYEDPFERLYAGEELLYVTEVARDAPVVDRTGETPEELVASGDFTPEEVGLPTGDNVDATLQERGSRYGEFDEHARITQAIKRAMADSPNWASLPDDMKEALEMVAHKAGRILNGDPDYHDSWHDIIGYVRLVEKRLKP